MNLIDKLKDFGKFSKIIGQVFYYTLRYPTQYTVINLMDGTVKNYKSNEIENNSIN